MILENFKLSNLFKKPENILRVFLALVFLSAGIFRVINPEIAKLEFFYLKLPENLSILTTIFEIITGLGLLFNKGTKLVYGALIAFLMFVLSWALAIDGKNLLASSDELFIFNLNPTDLFLHFVFLLLALVLIIKKK